jgi:hypothetical protein
MAKIESLSEYIRQIYKKFYVSGTNVAINEIILSFIGRSVHISK